MVTTNAYIGNYGVKEDEVESIWICRRNLWSNDMYMVDGIHFKFIIRGKEKHAHI